jgi:hypothetical protein
MAQLVSAGVSVTVTDESFFIPVSAATVPLFFIATQDEKYQPGDASPPLEAAGTFENNVIRTVTSLKQSIELYGVPNFLDNADGTAPQHGDARNEYGLFALNQYLGVGNRAYVIRADVNLNDDLDSIKTSWANKMDEAAFILGNLIQDYLNAQDALLVGSPPLPQAPGTNTIVPEDQLRSLARTATEAVWDAYSFSGLETYFFGNTSTALGLEMYEAGWDAATTGDYDGFDYMAANPAGYLGYPGFSGSPVTGFTKAEADLFFRAAADDLGWTREFLNSTSLGSNDADRRASIVQALAAVIAGNQDIRAESFEYNLVLCPGYPEVSDELFGLVVDMQEEAMIISDTPMNMDVGEVGTWAATAARTRTNHIAYYYPSALATNLDGRVVACAASGVALRTITFSDNVSYLWFAPAGLRRGLISGISELGYVSGVLGGATSFIPLALNNGDRDALYEYNASGDINPLVFFPGQGFVVWGQKTSAAAASAVDRINVERLMLYIKRQLRKNTLSFVFQPNDTLTRDNLKAVVDNFLGDLIVKRGLYDFVTVCDESNNTPDRIDRNEMYIDVAVKPVKAAEFIYIPIRIVATGAEI